VDTVFRAAAQLESMNADGIDGESYVAIIHPYAAYDLMRSAEWVDVHKYADPESIFKGEIGSLGNVRFVKSTEAKIFADESCPQFYQ
ncbi:N4-gp56 family major capsid protein, partial [Bacillus safensis]